MVAAGCGVRGPAGTPGPPANVTGEMIAGPIMSWLAAQTEFPVESPTIVLARWEGEGYDGFTSADVREATPLGIVGAFDQPTRDAISARLVATGLPLFVVTRDEAEDRAAGSSMCRPFREDGTLLALGLPLHPFVPADEQNRRLMLRASASRGCEGADWLLELAWAGGTSTVRRIEGYRWMA
jgi:hypothetical protein